MKHKTFVIWYASTATQQYFVNLLPKFCFCTCSYAKKKSFIFKFQFKPILYPLFWISLAKHQIKSYYLGTTRQNMNWLLKEQKRLFDKICVGGCVTSVLNCSDKRFDLRCTFMTSSLFPASKMPKNRYRSFANASRFWNTTSRY